MGFFQSMGWILITFVLFTALVAVISWWKTRGDNLDTAEGYFLASRSLPGVVIAGSLLLTNLSAEQLVGTNGQAWKSNMGCMAWEAGSAITLLVMAYYFLPRYLKCGMATIPQMLEERYDRPTKAIFSIGFLIVYICVSLPVILYSGALVFENIFGISTMFGLSKFGAIAIICVLTGIVGGCYAIFGGLKAVAVSDTINGVGLILGGLMVPFIGLMALGHMYGGDSGVALINGLQYMVTADPARMNAINAWNAPEPEVPWPLLFTGMFFNNLYAWCTHQSFVQRTLAARNLKEAQKGAIYAGFLKLMGPLYLVLPGIIAVYLLGDQVGMMDEAYPMLIAAIIPKPVMGFFAAVMFGAILSSFNSVLNSSVTMFTLDIYRGILRPKATDLYCVRLGKWVGTVLAVVSIAVSPFVYFASSGITTFLNSLLQYLAMPVLVAVLAGFIWDRLPAIAPKVMAVFHVVVYAAFMLIAPTYPGSDAPIHYLYAIAVLFPVDMLIMWLFQRFRPTDKAFVLKDSGAVDLTPWKYRHVASGLAIVLTIAIYILFSPLGLAK